MKLTTTLTLNTKPQHDALLIALSLYIEELEGWMKDFDVHADDAGSDLPEILLEKLEAAEAVWSLAEQAGVPGMAYRMKELAIRFREAREESL